MRARESRDAGTTLVEMLVAILLMSIVMAMATTGFITLLKTQQTAASRTATQADNRTGLEFVTRLLREATYGQRMDESESTIVTAASPTRLVFYSRLGRENVVLFDPVKGELRWGQSQPTCSADVTEPCTYVLPTPTHVLVRYMRNAPAPGAECTGEPADGAEPTP